MFETNRFIIGCSRHLYIAYRAGCRVSDNIRALSPPRPATVFSVDREILWISRHRTHERYSAIYLNWKVLNEILARVNSILFNISLRFVRLVHRQQRSSRVDPCSATRHATIRPYKCIEFSLLFFHSVFLYSVMHSFFLLQLSSFHSYCSRSHTQKPQLLGECSKS